MLKSMIALELESIVRPKDEPFPSTDVHSFVQMEECLPGISDMSVIDFF